MTALVLIGLTLFAVILMFIDQKGVNYGKRNCI